MGCSVSETKVGLVSVGWGEGKMVGDPGVGWDGYQVFGIKYWTVDIGHWVLGTGCWFLGVGYVVLDNGQADL